MTNDTKTLREFPKLQKMLVILLAISAVLFSVYLLASVNTKKHIQANLEPIVSELLQESGAEEITTKIYAAPRSYDLPWDLEFHVFLTANYADLRRISEATALEILNNGNPDGDKDYGYDANAMDYAVYTRTVTANAEEYPVFVILSDGERSYSMEKESLYNDNSLARVNALALLNPPILHKVPAILLLCALAFLALYGLLLRRKILNRIQLKNARQADMEEDWELGFEAVLRRVDREIAAERIAMKKRRNRNAAFTWIGILAVLILACALTVTLYVIPNRKYQDALALCSRGNTDEAYKILKSLDGFKDSDDLCNEIDYLRADAYLLAQDIPKAYQLLWNIQDYKDGKEQLALLESQYPALAILRAKPGDTVQLGEYEQDNNTENGKEPIEWIVLYNENGEAYLLSKYILDARPFNEQNTKECSLDDWLETDFSENAFGSLGLDIISRVGILQKSDIDGYSIPRDQITAQCTSYALSNKPQKSYDGGYSWWIVSDSLFTSSGDVLAPVVTGGGMYSDHSSEVTDTNGVRPALWLFADPDQLPAKPVFDGSTPSQWKPQPSSSSRPAGAKSSLQGTTCSRCNGTGKVTKSFGNSWNKLPGYQYGKTCGACGGTGVK